MANSRPPLASSASSPGSERSHARSHSKSRRRVDVSDRALTALATQTEARVHWGDILRNDAADEAGTKQWKWLDNMGQFSLYSKTEAGRYAVMARGVLSCSVPEVVHLLHTPHAEQFLQSMEGLYGEDFKDGAFLHRVNLHGLDEDGGVPLNADLLDLSVKSALFGNDHKWSFLDASYRRLDGMGFEKLMTTLNPRDVEGFDHTESGHPHRHHLENIVAAFTVQPEATSTRRERSASGHANLREGLPWKETRVFFYAEVSMPSAYTMSMMHKQPAGRTSSPGALAAAAAAPVHKAVKQRLLTMARSCERLTELVRRRRLGLHEVPERKTSRSLFAGPSRCVCCNKSVVLLAAKHCKLCTQAVCTECSRKHERETFTPGSRRMLVEDVRVCDRCMELVDCAELPELDNHALLAPVVAATPTSTPGVASPAPSPQSSLLTELLNNELLHAETDARKASVMSVIKAMLEQEQLEQEQHDQLSSTKGPSGPFKGHETRAHASSRGGGIMLMPTAPDSGATESFSKLSIH